MDDLTTLTDRLEAFAKLLKAELENGLSEFWQSTEADLAALLKECIEQAADALANRAWFLQKVASTRLIYVQCFEMMANAKYYDAWCKFERVEIDLLSLRRNPIYDIQTFGIEPLAALVARWQNLFPYKIFFSPEMAHIRVRCSICNAIVDPWSECSHEVGKVYAGQEAYHIVEVSEFLGVSIVSDPVQKYSVAFVDGADHHDYSIVKFVRERLTDPFDHWSATWTTAFHPHRLFKARNPNDGCPCGSGRNYENCCSGRPGVLRPHLHIEFEKAPPALLPDGHLAGYGQESGPVSILPHASTEKTET